MAEEITPPTQRSDATAAAFERPLLLTAGQDLAGYVAALIGKILLTAITCLTIVAVLLIFVFIGAKAIPFFQERGLTELFASTTWDPTHEPARFGALAFFYGSGMVTLGAMIIAVPIGILAAVFLSDMVSFRVRQIIKPVIEILAAIPSVAYGFFAILVVAPFLQTHMGLTSGTNMLNASMLLAVMAVPTIVSISEDALSAIPRELREGAYALGATRAEVLIKVIIPAAHSGIIAAIILGVMRAIGETMLVWMAAGMSKQIASPWWDFTASVATVTATIAGELPETPKDGLHYRALFGLGLSLLVITFVLNIVSEYFLARAKRLAQGKVKGKR